MLRERSERNALARIQSYAVYEASGRFEMVSGRPTVGEAIDELDAALEAEFESALSAADREFLELMGIA